MILNFLTGAFLCNSLPHLLRGLEGKAFPSPFARPPGRGDSSPLVNFLWGAFNLLAGLYLLSKRPVSLGANSGFLALAIGFIAIGIQLAIHFGKVQAEKRMKVRSSCS